MDSIDPAEERLAARRELLAIWQDPQVQRLALRYARNPELAEDALQEAYYAVARAKNPERIKNLRAYFCRTLINEVNHLRQFRATMVEDFERLVDTHQDKHGCSPALPMPVEECVSASLTGQAWLARLSKHQADLTVRIPSRSSDPGRYRLTIRTIATQVLCDILNGHVSEADSDASLRSAYPEWFDADGSGPANLYQRFSRARADIRALLKIVINRDELR